MNILELEADKLELKITFEKGIDAKQHVEGKIYVKDTIMEGKYDQVRIPCSSKTQLIIDKPTLDYLGPLEPKDHGFIYVQEIGITGYVTMIPYTPWKKDD